MLGRYSQGVATLYTIRIYIYQNVRPKRPFTSNMERMGNISVCYTKLKNVSFTSNSIVISCWLTALVLVSDADSETEVTKIVSSDSTCWSPASGRGLAGLTAAGLRLTMTLLVLADFASVF